MPGYEYIQSVSRALDILELLANSSKGLKLQHVASGLGVKRQTAHNLLRTLVHKGFVRKHSPPLVTGLGRLFRRCERGATRGTDSSSSPRFRV